MVSKCRIITHYSLHSSLKLASLKLMYIRQENSSNRPWALTVGTLVCGTFSFLVMLEAAFAEAKVVQTFTKQTPDSLVQDLSKQLALDELLQTIPSRQSVPTSVSGESVPPATAESNEATEKETISLLLRLG